MTRSKLTTVKSRLFAAFTSASLVVLIGCEQQGAEIEQIEVIDTGDRAQPGLTEPAKQSDQQSGTEPSVEQVDQAGTYSIQLAEGGITLNAKDASRMSIINDIASQIGFKVEARGDADRLITTDQNSVTVAALLENLLSDIPYSPEYAANFNDKGYRIRRLVIGSQSADLSTLSNDLDRVNEVEAGLGLPIPGGEIDLGSEPEEVELAQRLQFGSVEDRVIAVSELIMDPPGFDAAYQLFVRDQSPEVRLAILELIESEDYFVARQMIVAALRDPNKEVVLYALGIIDSLGDFSLVPQVQALTSHSDSEVVEYAKEVEEFLTEGYFEPNE